jgi:hypothetical protein
MVRLLLVAVAAATLAACASTPPNPLSVDSRGGVFVRDVAVGLTADEAKREAKPGNETAKKDMQVRLQAAVTAAFKNSPSGAQPVTLRIEITQYYINSMVTADVSVVRASDGQVLGVYKGVTGMHAQGGGLLGAVIEAAMKTDYVGIIANDFANTLRARFNGA